MCIRDSIYSARPNPPTGNQNGDGFHGDVDEARISQTARYKGAFTPEDRFTTDDKTGLHIATSPVERHHEFHCKKPYPSSSIFAPAGGICTPQSRRRNDLSGMRTRDGTRRMR